MNRSISHSVAVVFNVAAGLLFIPGEIHAQVEGGGAIVAIDEGAEGSGRAVSVGRVSTTKTSTRGTAARKHRPAPRTTPRPSPKKWDGFVVGDKYSFLNFEVISAAKPYHTREAKAVGASGLVQVEVLIDTNGGVLNAKARTGNKLLHPEAERAALESKFNRPVVYGKPARSIGFLVYRFGPDDD